MSSESMSTKGARREPEDVSKTLEYIKSLPIQTHRGLELPGDSTGVYIVYPGEKYYRKRFYTAESNKYTGPKGIKPPLFLYPGNSQVLVLVEGELNCMSLKVSIPDCPWTIASPGSASNFSTALEFCLQFPTVVCIIDRDPAGVAAGLSLKRKLTRCNTQVHLIALEKDLNDTIQDEGPEGVRQVFKTEMGL